MKIIVKEKDIRIASNIERCRIIIAIILGKAMYIQENTKEKE